MKRVCQVPAFVAGLLMVQFTGAAETTPSARTATAPAEEAGGALFRRNCAPCHGADVEATGTAQLARTRGKDKALLAGRQDMPPEYVLFVVRNGLRAMPAFLPTQVSDADARVLAEWLRRQKP